MSDENGLPPGWASAELSHLVHGITYGHTASASTDRVGPKFLRITDLQNDSVNWATVPFCPCESVDKYALKPGDIVIARTGATTGKSHLIEDLPEPTVFASYLIRLATSPRFPASYLARFMKSPDYWRQITVVKKGSAQPGANAKILGGLSVPVAPVNEQRRIVAKIDALQARSRRAREALDAVPALLERFRQAVLASAFRGDLTADWRAKNPDVEPASVLLDRIRVERRERWIEAVAEKARARAEAKAEKAGKPWGPSDDAKVLVRERVKAAKKYTEPEPVDAEAEGLPELPEGWCWARMEDLTPSDAPIVYGIILPKEHVPDGVPYIRPVDIASPGVVNLDDLLRTHPDIAAKYERAALKPGDLVYSIVGTIGKWVIADDQLDGANITQSSVRLRPMPGLSAEFLLRAFQSPQAGQQTGKLLFGNAIQRLNVAHVRELAVPLPPNGEREVMVRELGRALEAIAGLLATNKVLAARVDTLDQAILARAFRGELVPQDPDDEPASVLLERIKAEREAQATTKPKRRRGRPWKGA